MKKGLTIILEKCLLFFVITGAAYVVFIMMPKSAYAVWSINSVTPRCVGQISSVDVNFTLDASSTNRAAGTTDNPYNQFSTMYDFEQFMASGTHTRTWNRGGSGFVGGTSYTILLQDRNLTWPSMNKASQVFTALNCTISAPSISAQSVTGIGITSASFTSSVNPNNASTSITYRYSTTNTTCSSLGSTRAGPSGLTGSSVVSPNTTSTGTILTGNTTYYYCATANNSAGTTNGVSNNNANSNFLTYPGAATSLSVGSATQTSLTVSWTNPTGGAASYSLYYCDRTSNGSCTPNVLVTSSANTPQLHNSSITCGRTYAYLVRSVNATGTTDSSVATGSTTSCAAEPSLTLPTNTTPTSSTVTLGATVTSDNSSPITSRGVCYAPTATDSTPGFTTTTGSTPESGVTCTTTTGTTGLFTIPITGLSPNTQYTYRGFARNGIGNGYSSTGTFTTPTNAPTSVTTNNESGLASYKVTLNGSANPNGSQAYGYFRYFTSAPNCTVDSGGTRVPSSSTQDYDLGSGSSPVSFNITTSPAIPLVRNTNYWYCAYSRNAAAGAGSPGTSAAAGYDTFTTPDGPASGCDAPATGNLTISEPCTFPQSDYDGVDAGGSGTSNTAVITLSSGGNITILPGQRVARGGVVMSGGSFAIGNGNGGFIRGGLWLKDSDGDGIIDNPVVKTVNAAQPAGYIRRNYAYTLPQYNTSTFNYASKFYNATSTALDCDSTNGNIYQSLSNMVTDADNDGYKTSSAAGTQCVGASSTINGRTYYEDASGDSTWLPSASALGGGATDCQDNPNGAPCGPVNGSGTNGTNPTASAATTTQINLAWGVNSQGGAVPAVTSYDVYRCGLGQSGCASPSIVNVSSATTSYSNTSLTCSTSPSYYYRIVAKGANGDTQSNIISGVTSVCASPPTVTTDTAPSARTTTSLTFDSDVNPNGATTTVYYRYGTSNVACSSLPSVTAGTDIGSGTSTVTSIPLQQTGLSVNTRYYWCAYATNSQGTVYGAVRNHYTLPNAPTSPSAANVGRQQIVTVSWTASSGGASGGYRIYYCTGASCTPSINAGNDSASPFSHTSLACGTTYGYRIVALTADGEESAPSTTAYDSTISGSNTTCYYDQDNDGITINGPVTSTQCGGCDTTDWETTADSGVNADCYDFNNLVNPGIASDLYYTSDRGDGSFDYDCNGSVTFGQMNQYNQPVAYYINTCPNNQHFCGLLTSSHCGTSQWANSGCTCGGGSQVTLTCR